MAQRWVTAKMMLGAKHGFARSGAGRAMGDVWEDRMIGSVDPTVKGKPTKRKLLIAGCGIVDSETGLTVVARKTTADRHGYSAAVPVWKRPRGIAR